MIQKIILLVFGLSILHFSVTAGKVEAKRGVVADGYNFWVYQPEDAVPDSTVERKPLIVFLHGASLCGKDMNKVRRYGTIDAIERGRNIDAYVIAPQNPGGAWNPKKVMNLVDWMEEHYPVDSTRVYVMGMSLGGYGTLDVAAAYPDRIAAAMAFCGGATAKDVSGLNDVPLWIVHGTADRAISIKESDKVVSGMKSADSETPRLIYNRVPGMNHSQPARFFYMAETYDWLMTHNLDDEGRPLTEGFDITSQMGGAYKDLNHASKGATKKKSKKARSKKTKRQSKSKSKRK